MKNMKLYIITRRDLEPGAQAAQSTHVAIQFSLTYPELTREWSDASNNIALLAAPNEEALAQIFECALKLDDVRAAIFRETDLGDQVTAIALYGDIVRRMVSSLPLALKQRATPVQLSA